MQNDLETFQRHVRNAYVACTWEASQWQPLLQATLGDENTRVSYD